MKLSDLIPEITAAGYKAYPTDFELEIFVASDSPHAAIGIGKDNRLYYRIAPILWFGPHQDRAALLGFLQTIIEAHQCKFFEL